MEHGPWLSMAGGLCFVLGIVTVGSRTIATVGNKITKLTQATAFSVQSVRRLNPAAVFLPVRLPLVIRRLSLGMVKQGATLAVLISTAVGLPVSTSHCLVGALIGVGIAGKCAASSENGAPTTRNPPLDFTVLKKIVLAWCALMLFFIRVLDWTCESPDWLLERSVIGAVGQT